MNNLRTYLLLAASVVLIVLGCSDKSSDEACRHEVTMNLDKGNFDAVIASGCAGAMQRGAAYFGKAGFDVTNVINTLSETKDSDNASGGSSSNFSVHMTALLGKVNENSLVLLGNSKAEYLSIPATSESYLDAQFYVSFVDLVKGLSLLKSVLDVIGDGTLLNTCDKNSNAKLDSLDTTGCALLVGVGRPVSQCTPTGSIGVVTDSPNLTITNPASSGTDTHIYRGLILETSGTGTNVSSCPVPNQYKYLLVSKSSSTFYSVITTASGPANCSDNSGAAWPCPILDENGQPISIVTAFDESITSSINSMNTSLSSGATATSNDLLQSLTNIRSDACANGPCTEADIANYLQK